MKLIKRTLEKKEVIVMARTKSETIRQVTEEYLATLDVNNPPSPADVEGDILDNLKSAFDLENGKSWTNWNQHRLHLL